MTIVWIRRMVSAVTVRMQQNQVYLRQYTYGSQREKVPKIYVFKQENKHGRHTHGDNVCLCSRCGDLQK